MSNLFRRLVREEEGQDLIEYALLAGLISIVCILAITATGTSLTTMFNKMSSDVDAAVAGS